MLWEPGLAARQEGDAKAHPGSSLRDASDSSGSVMWGRTQLVPANGTR